MIKKVDRIGDYLFVLGNGIPKTNDWIIVNGHEKPLQCNGRLGNDIECSNGLAYANGSYNTITHHLPLNDAPVLGKCCLLPSYNHSRKIWQNIDIRAHLAEEIEKDPHMGMYDDSHKQMWVEGAKFALKKYLEKYIFTEEQMVYAIRKAGELKPFKPGDLYVENKFDESEILAELKIPIYPLAFEFETEDEFIPDPAMGISAGHYLTNIKITLNSENQKVAFGRYLYE